MFHQMNKYKKEPHIGHTLRLVVEETSIGLVAHIEDGRDTTEDGQGDSSLQWAPLPCNRYCALHSLLLSFGGRRGCLYKHLQKNGFNPPRGINRSSA